MTPQFTGQGGSITELGPEDFRDAGLRREGRWAVAFLADWCPFCRRFAPEFASLIHHRFSLAWADVSSEESPLWDRFQIEVVPTVVVFRDHRPVFRANGRYGIGLLPEDLAAIEAAASVE